MTASSRIRPLLIAAVMLLLLGTTASHAQSPISVCGTVTDAATGDPLPAASVHIDGTYRGTITNDEGQFALDIEALPATLVARFIGYETARREITDAPAEPIRIALQPSTLEMEELVVTGENPAERIMRRVIARKQQWRADLDTYRAEAYNRFTVASDTGIVSIVETETQAFWDRTRGMREVQTERRQTANLDVDDALPAAFFVTNLYDDDIEIGGHTLRGVTHPEALDHYRFTLEGTRSIDGQRVYDIGVEPAGRMKSAFEGRVAVLDSAYALLEADLTPGRSFVFPPPIRRYRVRMQQQFSNFGQAFWLPVDFRAQHRLKVAFSRLIHLPDIQIDQVSRMTNYATNVSLPDSLYRRPTAVAVDSTARVARVPLSAEASPDTLAFAGAGVPLTLAERRAYTRIDSTTTLEKAFAPRGPLGRLFRARMEVEDEREQQDAERAQSSSDRNVRSLPVDPTWRPLLWYNRVEGLHAGAAVGVDVSDRIEVEGRGGYNTSIDAPLRWSYGGRAVLRLDPDRRTSLFGSYRYGVDRRYDSPIYGRLPNSLWMLGGGPDYFDYLGSERVRVGLGHRVPALRAEVRLRYNDERQFSTARHTSYDLFGRNRLQPPNPAIEDGQLRALELLVDLGATRPQLGLFGEHRLALRIEHSSSDALASDFDFTRYALLVDGHFDTFFRRRLLPNALDVRIVAGTFSGTLPIQRFGIVDASWRPFSVFGALKTLEDRPYQGEQYAALFWEHSFRTVPLELLGLYGLAEQGYNFLIHGGHGRTWISDARQAAMLAQGIPVQDSEGFHHELGVSVSGLFGAFRLDFTKRLDAPGFTVGLGLARLY